MAEEYKALISDQPSKLVVDVNEPPTMKSALEIVREPFDQEQLKAGQEDTLEEDRVGDYTNEARSFIIERKTVSDIVSSIETGRMLIQLYNMNFYFSGNKFLLIEGKGGLTRAA